MIAPLSDAGQGTPASFVARSFALSSVPEKVVLNISAQGLYRAFVNGRRVGEDLLTPGWTCYDDRIAYQSYDIAPLLHEGENRIEIWLADGWFRSQMMWAANPIYNCWGNRIAAIADLVAGGETILATDTTWKSGLLPVRQSGIYYGEDYDARLGVLSETHGVEPLAFDTERLVPHETAPVRELPPLPIVDSFTDEEGRTIYDFGQNCGGYIRYTVEGQVGATVLVEHSEVLGPDRFFDNRNYRSAAGRTHYTLKGGAPETYAPHFTFQGFRYARVTVSGKAKITAIASIPISSVPERAGGLSSGLAAVDRLVENTVWSQRSNFIEVPTDCPQRDERLGWTGDAQVFAGTACWLADSQSFFRKFLRDVMADQRDDGAVSHFSPDPTRLHPIDDRGDWAGSTGWGDAIVIIPWQLYLHYGDRDVLAECFPAMLKWVDYLWALGEGPIVKTSSLWGSKGFTFGDWLQPVGDNRKPRPTIADDCAATLYHFISTDLAARIAEIIGKQEEAGQLRERAERIRKAFAHEYISPSGRLAHHDQTSYALAFFYGLVPAEHDKAARSYFRRAVEDAEYLIGTGFIGTPALLPALTKLGFHDLAEKVFLNGRVPGWLYQVEHGATTIWERWDAMAPDGTIYEPEMNSYNHYAYGAVCQWLFESVAGIAPDPDQPGFARVSVDPVVLPALGHVSAWHDCSHGRIEAGWTLEGERVRYTLRLPQGTAGLLATSAHRSDVVVDGRPAAIPAEGLALLAGDHVITFRMI
ncbi:MAG: family 78 glycoside hydrolase catalytic domain [Pararhizobium sp.]